MSKQPPPAPTARAVGPCPTLIQTSRTPRHWKFTQDHRTTRPPLKKKKKKRKGRSAEFCLRSVAFVYRPFLFRQGSEVNIFIRCARFVSLTKRKENKKSKERVWGQTTKEHSCFIISNSMQWLRRRSHFFLYLALAAILLNGAKRFEQFWQRVIQEIIL